MGKRWTVLLERQAERALRRVPRAMLARIDAVLLALEENPRPHDCKRLSGPLNQLYAIRAGEWRILYAVLDEQVIVLVVEIAPRGAVYRRR